MHSDYKITEILSKLNSGWTELLDSDSIERLCLEVEHNWRDRVLSPAVTIRLFLLQILHGNTSCNHLRHLSELEFSAASYCNARKRIPLIVFEQLLERIGKHLLSAKPSESIWKGHRVWLGDGTGCSMPDTKELQEYFGQPSSQREGCGFPVSHLLALMNYSTGMLQKLIVSPLNTHDISNASELVAELGKDDIVVFDRGFCSTPLILKLTMQGVHSVLRVPSSYKVDFRQANKEADRGIRRKRIRKLGKYDQLIEWHKPQSCPPWMSEEQYIELPDFILLREIKYCLGRRGFRSNEITIVTTLIDQSKYSRTALIQLYGMRWDIETNFRHLKTTMKMDTLKSRTVMGIKKELAVFTLAYNLVRQAMIERSTHYHVALKIISFIDTLRWLVAANTNGKPIINPQRNGCFVPRVVKKRPKAYPRMTSTRIITFAITIGKQTLTP